MSTISTFNNLSPSTVVKACDKASFRVNFRERLDWDHAKFLRFMITNFRLSANNWSAAKLYDADHPQLNMDQLMPKEEYQECWEQIKSPGIPASQAEAANSETQLWKECQSSVSKMCRTLTVKGREGEQSYVADDHKAHCEVDPSKHKSMGIKFIKHKADNRWGFVIDTTCARRRCCS